MLHFFALLPWLAEPFFGSAAEAATQLERRALSLPKLVFKPVSKPAATASVQAEKASAVEVQAQPEPEPEPEPKSKAKAKPKAKPVVQQALAKPVKKSSGNAEKSKARQPPSIVDTSSRLRAAKPQSASDNSAAMQKSSQVARSKSQMIKEVISKQPRFAQPPAAPLYPAQARRRQQQGTVWLDVRLDAQGRQMEQQVLRSSGVKSLDQAALAAVKKWQFLPELHNGVGVPSRVHIPIEFAVAAKP